MAVLLLSFSAHANGFTTFPPQNLSPLVFEDADHSQHTLADYRGKYVLLNIWATWCSPCVKEMPSLDMLQKQMPTLVVLPLSEDRGDTVVSAFYQNHALTHLPIAIDQAGMAPSALHLHGLPTTLLINPRGQEIARIEGDADWISLDIITFLRAQINAVPHP